MAAIVTIAIATPSVVAAAEVSVKPNADLTIKIWDNKTAPHSNNVTGAEYESAPNRVTDVSEPELLIYKADKSLNTGQAVVICPGGAYSRLAINHEGYQIAEWLAQNGITAAVLKYRLPNGVKEVPFEDAVEAIRIMRQRSKELGYSPDKIGIAGSSAGGHLAASVSVLAEPSAKPNFSILFYPVISGEKGLAHEASFDNLLGKDRTAELTEAYTLNNYIDENTPPAILFHSNDDEVVPTVNSTLYYNALRGYKKHSAIYVFPKGGHGWGETFEYRSMWRELLLDWMDKLDK